MDGKQIVRITETIRYVSISLIAFWLYNFIIQRGSGITETFYVAILGFLILMIGILIRIILQNQSNRFEVHKQSIKRERRNYVSVILIFPSLAIILFGSDYVTKFNPELAKIPQISSQNSYNSTDVFNAENFSSEDTLNLLEKYKISTTLLKPNKSVDEISWKKSKFGGYPNMESFSKYPQCDICHNQLNFVFQIYKSDFPEFYFPENSNIFQLFRCPNDKCKIAYETDNYDHKMFHYYSKVELQINKKFIKNVEISRTVEKEVPNCYLKPEKTFDFPTYYGYTDADLGKLSKRIQDDLADDRFNRYITKPYTKLGGYPKFIQDFVFVKCKCGRIKDLLFQLSSRDSGQDGVEYENPGNWSSHGIMIGDLGNIYYFICKHCGEKSIESYWDCS